MKVVNERVIVRLKKGKARIPHKIRDGFSLTKEKKKV